MGKKSKLKAIRRVASQMPVINTKQVIGERITGADAYAEGVKEVDGKPVKHDDLLKRKAVVEVPINHSKRMKKLYNQYGTKGVSAYINAVNKYQSSKDNKPDYAEQPSN